jgi:hypothetical protein
MIKNLKPLSTSYFKRHHKKNIWKEVPKAKKVTIKGFEKYDFFINEDKIISDGYIGGRVTASRFIPQDIAIGQAERNLRDVLKDRAESIADFAGEDIEECYGEAFEELMEGNIKKYGLSPRYKIEEEEDF